jgi:ribosomal protein S18 acetylase RimI-like enzyme
MNISPVKVEQIEQITELFDRYRIFYAQTSDLNAARKFIAERLAKQDSIILVAEEANKLLGFTQLYPSFSSVGMKRIWILNDLFVLEEARQKGIGKALMNAAKNYAQSTGALRIVLATQISNATAQHLYESLGYLKDNEFYNYSLLIK